MLSKPTDTKKDARAKRLPAGAALALLSGLGLAAAQPAQAQYSLTAFNVGISGSSNTNIYGINDSGQIVGSYATVSSGGLTTFHGYYGTTAAQTAVNGPTGLVSTTNPFTEINKINNAGTYVGDYEAGSGGLDTPQGFTGSAGTVTPMTTANSAAMGINNAAMTVGQVFNASGSSSQSFFQPSGGTLTTFSVPGYGTSMATGINDSGVMVGTAAIDALTGPTVSYVRSAGASPTFSFLNITGALDVYAQGINNSGIIVGAYDTAQSGGNLTGFVAFNGTVTNVVFPSAASTQVNGINSLGQIVGTYTDAAGALHGFVGAPPIPEASTTVSLALLLALGLGGMVVSAKRKKARNAA